MVIFADFRGPPEKRKNLIFTSLLATDLQKQPTQKSKIFPLNKQERGESIRNIQRRLEQSNPNHIRPFLKRKNIISYLIAQPWANVQVNGEICFVASKTVQNDSDVALLIVFECFLTIWVVPGCLNGELRFSQSSFFVEKRQVHWSKLNDFEFFLFFPEISEYHRKYQFFMGFRMSYIPRWPEFALRISFVVSHAPSSVISLH